MERLLEELSLCHQLLCRWKHHLHCQGMSSPHPRIINYLEIKELTLCLIASSSQDASSYDNVIRWMPKIGLIYFLDWGIAPRLCKRPTTLHAPKGVQFRDYSLSPWALYKRCTLFHDNSCFLLWVSSCKIKDVVHMWYTSLSISFGYLWIKETKDAPSMLCY